MKEYSVQDSKRNMVFGIVVIVYVLLVLAFNIYLSQMVESLGMYAAIVSVLSISPLPLAMLTMRLPIMLKLSNIPNLQGTYEGGLYSNYTNYKKEINVKMTIKQNVFKMDILIETETSKSHSVSIDVDKLGDSTLLSYIYENRGSYSETLSKHGGVCTLSFFGNDVEGEYYTSPERNTNGKIKLSRCRSE